MTAYILTPEQHAQIVDAAESNAEYAEAEYLDRREFWGEALDYRWKNLQEASEQAKATLAMLKAMKPVEPVACIYNGNQYMRHEFMSDTIPEGSTPLYTLGDTA